MNNLDIRSPVFITYLFLSLLVGVPVFFLLGKSFKAIRATVRAALATPPRGHDGPSRDRRPRGRCRAP